MPIRAQDILAWFIVLSLGGGYAVLMYATCLKCAVEGCWRQTTYHVIPRAGGSVCQKHWDER